MPSRKHGRSVVDYLYSTWCGMKQRCENPNVQSYPRYGGRGIKVCERWQSFENFAADMGERPDAKHTLDREDSNRGYEPGNCRWATAKVQARCHTERRDAKTHCSKGHEFTPKNTYMKPGGAKVCRTCIRDDGRQRMRLRYAVAKAHGIPGRRWKEVSHLIDSTDISDVRINPQAERTHCPAGHEYSRENTYHKNGRRHCRACNRAAVKRSRGKRSSDHQSAP